MPIIAAILFVILAVLAFQPEKTPEQAMKDDGGRSEAQWCEKRAIAEARFPSTVLLGGTPTVERRDDDILVVKGTIGWLGQHATYDWHSFECTYQKGALLYWSYAELRP